MKLIVVSGMSGAGKSVALNTLEDLGYYCIDNLPANLLPAFAIQMVSGQLPYEDSAVGIDARNPASELQRFPEIFAELREQGVECELLFLEADDPILIKRFSETRRKHPLTSHAMSLAEAIARERELLADLARHADLRLDTSHTNLHQLRDVMMKRVTRRSPGSLSLLVESFGYKQGVPRDADFVFDVRCLPNPHWIPELRPLTGKDSEVAGFLKADPLAGEMFQELKAFLERWVPRFLAEGRSYLTVAIGCTGGQHRSVYLAEQLGEYFKSHGSVTVIVRHRELAE
jgi:UPF0042 nucleotide-binding protein